MNNSESNNSSLKAIQPVDFLAPGEPLADAKPLADEDALSGRTAFLDSNSLNSSAQGAHSPWWHSEFNLMLAVFGLLALAAVVFIALMPSPTANQNRLSTVVQVDGETSTAPVVLDAVAPYDESRRAQARTDSQDILAELLDVQKDLEQKNVSDWAGERFSEALDKAAAGDEFYKRQQFVDAIQTYQTALADLQSINQLIPDVMKSLLQSAQIAISEGKTELARAQYEEALKLDSNNIPALRGLDRANTLDEVLALMQQANEVSDRFKRNDELATAVNAQAIYQQALELDSVFEPAQQGLGKINQLIADKRYRDAMTEGFNALFAGQYTQAKSGFSVALGIRPDDPTASSAYRQSLASDKRTSLSSLLSAAKQMEANEEWNSALSNYQAVLQRDSNQVAAKLGQIRARARAKLNTDIETVLSDQLAMARESQRERAEKVLSDARAIRSPGPSLARQVAALEQALLQIDQTIKVSFTSDAATRVKLTKAGANPIDLGRFTSKNLALKPGRYLISGERLGFRDVRRELELKPGGEEIRQISILCTQPIAGRVESSERNKDGA